MLRAENKQRKRRGAGGGTKDRMARRPANGVQMQAALSPWDKDLWEMFMIWPAARENPSLSPSLICLPLSLSPSLDPTAAVPALAHLLHLLRKALDQG